MHPPRMSPHHARRSMIRLTSDATGPEVASGVSQIQHPPRMSLNHARRSMIRLTSDATGSEAASRRKSDPSQSERHMLIAFHKPYGVLSQFTADGSPNQPLAGFGFPPNVYAIGRLDADSEGLLLLSDEPALNERLLHPRSAHTRTYWVQVERVPTADALDALERGVLVQGRRTLGCRAWMPDPQPQPPPRTPPIRFRKTVPD